MCGQLGDDSTHADPAPGVKLKYAADNLGLVRDYNELAGGLVQPVSKWRPASGLASLGNKPLSRRNGALG